MLANSRLIALRKKNGLTQDDVAKIINTSRPNYTRYENGASQPPNDSIVKLAELFEVSTDYLLGTTNIPAPYSADKEPPAEITAEVLQEIAEEAAGRPLTYEELIVLHTRVDDLVATIDKLVEDKK